MYTDDFYCFNNSANSTYERRTEYQYHSQPYYSTGAVAYCSGICTKCSRTTCPTENVNY